MNQVRVPSWALYGIVLLLVLCGCTQTNPDHGPQPPNCGNRICNYPDENVFSCPEDCDAFCPRSCDDFNPCTLDSCDASTGYQCQHELLNGDQTGCTDKTCTGNCYCTNDPGAKCATDIQIGSCQTYSCNTGVCRTTAQTNCCGNGICENPAGENYDTCPKTKGGDCDYKPYCGNGICDVNEDCGTCQSDCGTCLFAGYLDTPGMHATYLTRKQYFTGLDKTVFTSDPDTLFQYTGDFTNIPESYYKDKLQNYCLVTTGATCQRVDIFSLLKNTRSVPVTNLEMSYFCYDPVNNKVLLNSKNGYIENYMKDWNITAYSLPNQTLFTPSPAISLTGQNIQAKGSFYIPSDVSNDTQVNALLNNASGEGSAISFLGPQQKAGLNFKLLTMAAPNNNLQFDCNLTLAGKFGDGLAINQSYSFTVNSIHKNLLCGSAQPPSACQQYVLRNGLCQLEYMPNCCGNKVCEADETYDNCSIDQGGDCPYTIACGNSVCDTNAGETIWTCPNDCGAAFKVGVLESNHLTVLAANQWLNGAFRTSQSFLDLNSTSIRLLSSNNFIGDGNYNLCTPTGTQSCQRIDAHTQVLNNSTESFTSLDMEFSCRDPRTGGDFFDSNASTGSSQLTTRLIDWNYFNYDTGREYRWIDRNTTSTGEELSGRAQFYIDPVDADNVNTKVVLNTGDTNGTRVLLLKPLTWVDFNMSFLSKASKTILYDCNITFSALTEYNHRFSDSGRFYLRFFHP